MALDLDSGELHIISGWSNDEDDNLTNGGKENCFSCRRFLLTKAQGRQLPYGVSALGGFF